MLVSICRQLGVLVPTAYLLAVLFRENINLFWFSFPIAEIMSMMVTALGFVYIYKKIIKHIPDCK